MAKGFTGHDHDERNGVEHGSHGRNRGRTNAGLGGEIKKTPKKDKTVARGLPVFNFKPRRNTNEKKRIP